ncbi:crooked neck-like protein [Anaeramoeba ignava]|uniref:Crooked neck-like protein n=1 Tax=Anaeramoeba ignava TaxID=1746090 RepID=A0A9Q0RGB4_ANAIG|nr:crooked neck-like protein [Anaeramoeba ignava]
MNQLPKQFKPKNKNAAKIQITAEHLLKEALAHQEKQSRPPEQIIMDEDELQEYRSRKRRNYENAIRRTKFNMGSWVRYAQWEASQGELIRARSVFERAISTDYTHVPLWLNYVDMEMKYKNINDAKNVFDRAVSLLPRENKFWYKYVYMQELLGNVDDARNVFKRWMEWEPDEAAWLSYIKFEIRYNEIQNARAIYEGFIRCKPKISTYLRYAKWEKKYGNPDSARKIYERTALELGEDILDESYYCAFAKFEEEQKEFDRARAIYKYGLDHISKKQAVQLYKEFISFEKQNGNQTEIEEVIYSKRKFQYEDILESNPRDYDIWFDYIRLEENHSDINRIREVYERAVENRPPAKEKRFWKRYIYLWINYGLFEELQAKEITKAREVYKRSIEGIPEEFSFSKIWIMYAHFEIRCKDTKAARKVYGNALGRAPKDKIYREYILTELQLGNVNRCRILYEKYLEFSPANSEAWIKFAELEQSLGETNRARSLFEIAIQQPLLDAPELIWKSYIDFENQMQNFDNVRNLYQRLLEKTEHVKVWIAYAKFECEIDMIQNARDIFKNADQILKNQSKKDERSLLLDSWIDFENEFGDSDSLLIVQQKLPKKILKRREVPGFAGNIEIEEYWDYEFPDEKEEQANVKFLEMAKKWKEQKMKK